jgi:hypothetical protein
VPPSSRHNGIIFICKKHLTFWLQVLPPYSTFDETKTTGRLHSVKKLEMDNQSNSPRRKPIEAFSEIAMQ